MQVKMITSYASALATCPPKGIIDLDEKEAQALIDGGYAEAVTVADAKKKVVKATSKKGGKRVETADKEIEETR